MSNSKYQDPSMARELALVQWQTTSIIMERGYQNAMSAYDEAVEKYNRETVECEQSSKAREEACAHEWEHVQWHIMTRIMERALHEEDLERITNGDDPNTFTSYEML
jgi:hypothetical protein